MKRLLAAVSSLLLLFVGLLASPVSAETSARLSYAQLQADQRFMSFAAEAERQFQQGAFQMLGGATSSTGKRLTTESFSYDGLVLRNKWGPYGAGTQSSTTINYLNIGKQQTCSRQPSQRYRPTLKGDKRARWTCVRTLDKGTMTELYIQTPLHKAEVILSRYPDATFTYEFLSADSKQMRMTAYTSEGAIIEANLYLINPPLSKVRYQTRSVAGGTSGRIVDYYITALTRAHDPIDWKQLKKRWKRS